MILYGTDPVVVEYDPGTDIVIEKFSFLPVSDDFFQGNQNSYIRPFSGETSFYNEKTGSYDPVDIRKQDFIQGKSWQIISLPTERSRSATQPEAMRKPE